MLNVTATAAELALALVNPKPAMPAATAAIDPPPFGQKTDDSACSQAGEEQTARYAAPIGLELLDQFVPDLAQF